MQMGHVPFNPEHESTVGKKTANTRLLYTPQVGCVKMGNGLCEYCVDIPIARHPEDHFLYRDCSRSHVKCTTYSP